MLRNHSINVACCFVITLMFAGCFGTESTQTIDTNSGKAVGTDNESHEHGDADKLVWVKKDLNHDGFTISLGHHGETFHVGDSIEPAIMITKDGEDVADAIVHNSMISSDTETVLVEEAKTVYEPKTDSEPAHYAQAKMTIPTGAQKFLIRFKIELPGSAEPELFDISIDIGH